jgi:regulator of Ty1 transposition protein 103
MRESSPGKKLVLIYLANGEWLWPTRQDSKLIVVTEITQTSKMRRVVEVWRQRQIFSLPTQQEVEKRINGM